MVNIHYPKPQRILDVEAGEITLTPEDDSWVPACGGTETPFTSRSGIRMLYCWNKATGKHAYIDLGQDRVMEDDEAIRALGMC